MKSNFNVFALLVLLGVVLLSACGGAPAPAMQEAPAAPEFYADEGGSIPGIAPAMSESESAKSGADSSVMPVGPVYNTGAGSAPSAGNMIIKNADVKLLVEDTDIAIDRATQIVSDAGGYIISSRVWYQPHNDGENYKYATTTIGVPFQQFERTLTRLRGISVKVLDETASGEDVTNQYVDLQSQLTNLEATRDRVKSFLDDAKTVDEALRINSQLSEIERQIEEIKGRMNYLKDRAAYSTITITFQPELPEILPTPTPEPNPWNPGETFESARNSVTRAYQGIVDLLIWFFIVLVPIFAPPALIVWIIWKAITRKKPGKPAQ
jgi:hypothetical protein